jgi:hypothetical protein
MVSIGLHALYQQCLINAAHREIGSQNSSDREKIDKSKIRENDFEFVKIPQKFLTAQGQAEGISADDAISHAGCTLCNSHKVNLPSAFGYISMAALEQDIPVSTRFIRSPDVLAPTCLTAFPE